MGVSLTSECWVWQWDQWVCHQLHRVLGVAVGPVGVSPTSLSVGCGSGTSGRVTNFIECWVWQWDQWVCHQLHRALGVAVGPVGVSLASECWVWQWDQWACHQLHRALGVAVGPVGVSHTYILQRWSLRAQYIHTYVPIPLQAMLSPSPSTERPNQHSKSAHAQEPFW